MWIPFTYAAICSAKAKNYTSYSAAITAGTTGAEADILAYSCAKAAALASCDLLKFFIIHYFICGRQIVNIFFKFLKAD